MVWLLAQELQAAINAATPCWGRLFMFLTQDVQVQRLQAAANRIEAELNANVKATKHYAQPELRVGTWSRWQLNVDASCCTHDCMVALGGGTALVLCHMQ